MDVNSTAAPCSASILLLDSFIHRVVHFSNTPDTHRHSSWLSLTYHLLGNEKTREHRTGNEVFQVFVGS